MTLYLVRHAKAGERAAWDREDWLRPLSRRGQRQADGLLDVLADAHIDRVLSSPYVRCLESVAPLAGERRLAIEPLDALAEGAKHEDAMTLVRKHTHHDVVMCSHGDVIPMLLEHFESRGVDLGPTLECPKGCTWVVGFHATGDPISAKYLPPPPD
ncbi:MAG: SixA phosphatase family protein [Actinomycetota bacterium]